MYNFTGNFKRVVNKPLSLIKYHKDSSAMSIFRWTSLCPEHIKEGQNFRKSSSKFICCEEHSITHKDEDLESFVTRLLLGVHSSL